MPVEIRELVVRVAVEETAKKEMPDQKDLADLKNKIVKECVEKVIAKLENMPSR